MSGKVIKSVVLIFFSVIISSCSLTRNIAEKDVLSSVENRIIAGNITDTTFGITKMTIEYLFDGRDGKVNAFLKYQKGGDCLISVRTIAGIEAARILWKNDTVKVIDRINEVLYWGTTKDIVRKYSISNENFRMIFGKNFLSEEYKDQDCEDGIIKVSGMFEGIITDFEIDCLNNQLLRAKRKMGSDNGFELENSDFKQIDGYFYPEKVNAKIQNNSISIVIERIRLEQNVSLKFPENIIYEVKRL